MCWCQRLERSYNGCGGSYKPLDGVAWAIASARGWAVMILMAVVAGCNDGFNVEDPMATERLSSGLLIRFTEATDAANRAVMAGTDETATEYSREAEQATQIVQRDADALKLLLTRRGYTTESRLLDEFITDSLDIGNLTTPSSAWPSRTPISKRNVCHSTWSEEADAFRDALESVARAYAQQRTIGRSRRSRQPLCWRCARFRCCRPRTSRKQTTLR